MSLWHRFLAAVEAAQVDECPAPPWTPEALAELRRVSGPRAVRVGTTKGGSMSDGVVCVEYKGGWCALKRGAKLDPSATQDETACGHFVILRTGNARREPTCPECRLALAKNLRRRPNAAK